MKYITDKAWMIIEELKTTEYPTRTMSYFNHGIWVEQVVIGDQSGFECAVYYEPYENSVYSGVLDAIYIEVISCGNGVYRVNGYAVRPDAARDQLKMSEWRNGFQEAKNAALLWLGEAKRFVFDSEDSFSGNPKNLFIIC